MQLKSLILIKTSYRFTSVESVCVKTLNETNKVSFWIKFEIILGMKPYSPNDKLGNVFRIR